MLSLRSTLALCALTLLLAAWTCWTVASAATIPAFWLSNPALSPYFIAGLCVVLAAFFSPLIFTKIELSSDAPWELLGKVTCASAWFALASAFMMLTAARVSPLNGTDVASAALWIFSGTWIALVLHRIAPRAASAILFFWIVALPIVAYLLAEIFLTSPAGGTGLAESTAPQTRALRETIRWILNLAPSTGTVGALAGTMADGSEFSLPIALGEISVVGLFLGTFAVRKPIEIPNANTPIQRTTY